MSLRDCRGGARGCEVGREGALVGEEPDEALPGYGAGFVCETVSGEDGFGGAGNNSFSVLLPGHVAF